MKELRLMIILCVLALCGCADVPEKVELISNNMSNTHTSENTQYKDTDDTEIPEIEQSSTYINEEGNLVQEDEHKPDAVLQQELIEALSYSIKCGYSNEAYGIDDTDLQVELQVTSDAFYFHDAKNTIYYRDGVLYSYDAENWQWLSSDDFELEDVYSIFTKVNNFYDYVDAMGKDWVRTDEGWESELLGGTVLLVQPGDVITELNVTFPYVANKLCSRPINDVKVVDITVSEPISYDTMFNILKGIREKYNLL